MTLVLSLFPGIGLLDRAFEEEGFTVVRGPDVLWGGDIRSFHPPAGKFDGVIGGPPCQMFSALAHLVRANGYEPKFGNLIPEFERCVAEADPWWFLMENVRAAPVPVVKGYAVHLFEWDNSWLGEEQMRRRRFSFGVRDPLGQGSPVDLRRWMPQAALELPKKAKCILGHGPEVPVKIGGSGKVKRSIVTQCVVDNSQEAKGRAQHVTLVAGGGKSPGQRAQAATVTAAHAYAKGSVTSSDGGASVRMTRYKLADANRLQGLPEDFLADAPFTAVGKLKAVANGVPIPLGRAIARAIKEAEDYGRTDA